MSLSHNTMVVMAIWRVGPGPDLGDDACRIQHAYVSDKIRIANVTVLSRKDWLCSLF